MNRGLRQKIFDVESTGDFRDLSLEIMLEQYRNNTVYRAFCDNLNKDIPGISDIGSIPFLPVEFFRNHVVLTGDSGYEAIFQSSGTTGMIPGKHYVKDLSLYEESFVKCFERFYGDPSEFLIVALLPSYQEREGSSLVYMVDRLIKMSTNEKSGFYRNKEKKLIDVLMQSKLENKKTLLIGVSYALLDIAEMFSEDLSGVIIMETGGMKGRRKEIIRGELHDRLKKSFNVDSVHSEYGMTELLSQAYSNENGIFHCPPWMKILLRDPLDPLSLITEPGKTGGINIIDLANIDSCSFISTGDLGRLTDDGGFEVLGRFDNSDIRGCNLLAE